MRLVAALRSQTRRLLDRIAQPYIDAIAAQHSHTHSKSEHTTYALSPHADPAGVPTDFFHHVNHELRTIELERVPKGGRSALSVGASGRWYFEWFEQAFGPLDTHYGVEAFEPQPPDLPPYAMWISAPADRMEGVGDAAVDIVFAGQTTEHLWADELTGFLRESHRVLRPDGLLVLDSPNRLVTEHLEWSHGQHTVELSASEISSVLELAGFAVESRRGIWRCRFGDRVLQLEEGLDDGAMLVRRIAEGPAHVDDSFIWWMVARRAHEAEVDDLRNLVDSLYARHWPTRVCRGMFPAPGASRRELNGDPVATLPFYLRRGRTHLTVRLSDGGLANAPDLRVDLTAPGGHVLRELRLADAMVAGNTAGWELDTDLVFAVTLAIHASRPRRPTFVELPIGITQSASF